MDSWVDGAKAAAEFCMRGDGPLGDLPPPTGLECADRTCLARELVCNREGTACVEPESCDLRICFAHDLTCRGGADDVVACRPHTDCVDERPLLEPRASTAPIILGRSAALGDPMLATFDEVGSVPLVPGPWEVHVSDGVTVTTVVLQESRRPQDARFFIEVPGPLRTVAYQVMSPNGPTNTLCVTP